MAKNKKAIKDSVEVNTNIITDEVSLEEKTEEASITEYSNDELKETKEVVEDNQEKVEEAKEAKKEVEETDKKVEKTKEESVVESKNVHTHDYKKQEYKVLLATPTYYVINKNGTNITIQGRNTLRRGEVVYL